MAESREQPPPPPQAPDVDGNDPIDDLVDRFRQWLDALLHPPVLVPVPVPRRR
jgi:hypothetical protein